MDNGPQAVWDRLAVGGWETGKQVQWGTGWREYDGAVHRVPWGPTRWGFRKEVFYNNKNCSGLGLLIEN